MTDNALQRLVTVPEVLKAAVDKLSPNTKRAYYTAWGIFAVWAGQNTLDGALSVMVNAGRSKTNLMLLNYQTYLKSKALAPSTVNLRLYAVLYLLTLARRGGLIEWVAEIDPLKVTPYRDVSGPSQEEINAMMATAGRLRDKAMLWVAFTLGLRRGEIVSLNLGDLQGDRLKVRRKGKTEDTLLTVPPETVSAVNAYLARERPDTDCNALFLSVTGNRLSGEDVYRILKRLGWSPHKIRHSGVTEALNATEGNIAATAAWAGHSNPQTTGAYDDARQDRQGQVARTLAARVKPR